MTALQEVVGAWLCGGRGEVWWWAWLVAPQSASACGGDRLPPCVSYLSIWLQTANLRTEDFLCSCQMCEYVEASQGAMLKISKADGCLSCNSFLELTFLHAAWRGWTISSSLHAPHSANSDTVGYPSFQRRGIDCSPALQFEETRGNYCVEPQVWCNPIGNVPPSAPGGTRSVPK